MNPLRWFRWKIVIGLAVVFGALYFLGLNPLAERELNKIGTSGDAGARFSVEKVALGILQGRSSLNLFTLATNRAKTKDEEAKDRVAQADEVVFDLGMDDLLSRRAAIDEISVVRPLLKIERRKDGSINIGDLGTKEPEAPKGEAGSSTDWVKAAQEWAEKIRKRVEERRKREAERRRAPPEVAKRTGWRPDYAQRIEYPFERNPRLLVRTLKAEALEIQFDDQTGNLKPPAIKNASVSIENLSDRPEWVGKPIVLKIKGEIEGGNIDLSATLDLTTTEVEGTRLEKNDLLLQISADKLPLKTLVQALAGNSLDFVFEDGLANLNAQVNLLDFDRLAVHSKDGNTPLFSLAGVKMSAKPGAKIAGLDGRQFAKVVNDVGGFEVKDLEIGGTFLRPEFKWGNGLQEFLVSGGKQYLQKEGQKQLDKGLEKGKKELERQLEKTPGLKGLIPKDVDKTLKGIGGGALEGLLGPKKPAEGTKAADENK